MPSENNVQILKESKARFEGVIFKQTADLGTIKETSCKVIDEATGEVIAQSGGGGGGGEFAPTNLTFNFTSEEEEAFTEIVLNAPIVETGEEGATSIISSRKVVEIEAGVEEKVPIIVIDNYNTLVTVTIDSEEETQIDSVSGDAEQVPGLGIVVWGEATINIVASPK